MLVAAAKFTTSKLLKVPVPFAYEKSSYSDFSQKAIEHYRAILPTFDKALSDLARNQYIDTLQDGRREKLLLFIRAMRSYSERLKSDRPFIAEKNLSVVKFLTCLDLLVEKAAVDLRRFQITLNATSYTGPKALEPLVVLIGEFQKNLYALKFEAEQNSFLAPIWRKEYEKSLHDEMDEKIKLETTHTPIVEEYQSQIEQAYNQKIAELTRLTAEYNQREAELQEEAKKAQQKILEEKEAELKQVEEKYNQELLEKQRAVEELKMKYFAETEARAAELKKSEAQLIELGRICQETKAACDKAKEEKENLEAVLTQAKEQANEALKQEAKLREEQAKLSEELTKKLQEILQSQEMVLALKASVDAKTSEIDATRRKAQELQEELAKKKEEADAAHKAAEELARQVEEQKAALHEKDEEIDVLNITLTDREAEVENLRNEVFNKSMQIEELEKVNESLRANSTHVSQISQVSQSHDEAFYSASGGARHTFHAKKEPSEINPIATELLNKIEAPNAKRAFDKLLRFYAKNCIKRPIAAAAYLELAKDLLANYFGNMQAILSDFQAHLVEYGEPELYSYVQACLKAFVSEEKTDSEKNAALKEFSMLLDNFKIYCDNAARQRKQKHPLQEVKSNQL